MFKLRYSMKVLIYYRKIRMLFQSLYFRVKGLIMNMVSRSLLISCLWSIAAYTAPITILEKQIKLGKDPKTEKTLMAKAYSFQKGPLKKRPILVGSPFFLMKTNSFSSQLKKA